MSTVSLPPYSSELSWPEELGPFETVDFAIQADPFPHYAWMRENAPVLRTHTPEIDVWYISRYQDVRSAFRAPKVFASGVLDPTPLIFPTLLDAPYHTKMRRVVAASFTPNAVAKFEGQIRAHSSQYLDGLLEAGGGDVIEKFAMPLTMATIGSLLGIPATDFAKLKSWSDDLSDYFGRLVRQAPGSDHDETGSLEFFEYLKMNLERASRADDGTVGSNLGKLCNDGVLSETEATHFSAFLFLAGHETTTALIGNSILNLSQAPELLARIRRKPSDAVLFVEEMARYRGTVQRPGRITRLDVEVAGTVIPCGANVRLLPGSANRDELKFKDAEVFDIDRDTDGHLGFGHGVHSCLGAPLARLEGKIAVEAFAQRVDEVHVSPDSPVEYIAGGNLANTGPSRVEVVMTGPTQGGRTWSGQSSRT